MRLVTDLSVVSARRVRPSGPERLFDFAAGIYRAAGLPKTLGTVMSFTRASSATYRRSDGLYDLAGVNQPRIDQSPAGAPLGLLIEGAATNLTRYTFGQQQFANAPNSATVTPSGVNGPDGRTAVLDMFDRADTSPGTIGGGWSLAGPYVASFPLPVSPYGYISNGRFTADANQIVYAWRNTGQTIQRIGARVVWRAGPGAGAASTAALIISANANLITDMVHIVLTRSVAKVQKRVAGGVFVDLITINLSPAIAIGAAVDIDVQVCGTQAVMTVNGITGTATDADLPSLLGGHVVAECYSTSATALDLVGFESVYAGPATAAARITSSAANGRGNNNITVPNDSATYLSSVYLRKKAVSQTALIGLIFVGGTTKNCQCPINLQTGALGFPSNCTAIVEDAGDWWRVGILCSNNGTGNTIAQQNVVPDTVAANTCDAWGSSLVSGATGFTSPILTGGATATRAADVPGVSSVTGTYDVTLTYDDLSEQVLEDVAISPGWWPVQARPWLRRMVIG